jgi:hypothetical protein
MRKFEIINRPLTYNKKVLVAGRTISLDEDHAQILMAKGRIKEVRSSTTARAATRTATAARANPRQPRRSPK